VEDSEITVAVVGDPSTGEIDVAERRRGAWRLSDGGRHRLHTSDESRTIVIEDGKSSGRRREHAARFAAAAIHSDSLVGSATRHLHEELLDLARSNLDAE
jgi:fructose-1,6-bisphosphatase/inositol monophosphatase family enzyme